MESNGFSGARIWALLERYWTEQKKQLLLYNLLAVSLLCWMSISAQHNYNRALQILPNADSFAVIHGTAIYMMLHMSLVFKDISNRKRGAFFMVIPTTGGEKFMYLLTVGLVVPLAMYIALVSSIDWAVFHYLYPQNKMLLLANLKKSDLYPLMVELYYLLLLFVGFLAFKKHQLIYTILIIVLVFGFGVVWLEGVLSRMIIFSRIVAGSPLGSFEVVGFGPYVMSSDNGLIFDYPQYSWAFLVAFVSLIIYGANLQFREKQFKV